MQAAVFLPQGFPVFDKGRIDGNTGNRADLHALGLVKMAHALGALVRVNLVDLDAHVNRVVRAFGLANVAVEIGRAHV